MPVASNLIRHSSWEEALGLYLDRKSDEPFSWKDNDCARFARGAIRAQTGTDPAPELEDYTTRQEALEVLRTKGQGTLLRTLTSLLGQSKHVALAQRGDIVMRDSMTIGVCVGAYSWFIGQEGEREGLVAWPTASCKRAFAVPFRAEGDDSE